MKEESIRIITYKTHDNTVAYSEYNSIKSLHDSSSDHHLKVSVISLKRKEGLN